MNQEILFKQRTCKILFLRTAFTSSTRHYRIQQCTRMSQNHIKICWKGLESSPCPKVGSTIKKFQTDVCLSCSGKLPVIDDIPSPPWGINSSVNSPRNKFLLISYLNLLSYKIHFIGAVSIEQLQVTLST